MWVYKEVLSKVKIEIANYLQYSQSHCKTARKEEEIEATLFPFTEMQFFSMEFNSVKCL